MAALVESLARPVAMGLLPMRAAEAAIAATLGRQWRETGAGYGAKEIDDNCWVLRLRVRLLRNRRQAVLGAIRRQVREMSALQARWGAVLAEAHEINSRHDSLLVEREVTRWAEHQAADCLARANGRPQRRKF